MHTYYPSALSRTLLVLLTLITLTTPPPSFVSAQEGDAPPVPSLYKASEPVPNALNCFDYYTFGSVQANIEGTVGSTVSGTSMHFQGNLENNNPYPVVEGALYAKVFTKQGDERMTHQNGHNLVDQFFVQENLSIPAHGKFPIEFDWNVPAYAATGDYQIAFFVTSAKKFNLLGLSFTDDVVGNVFDFSVTGERATVPAWNKNTVTIGEKLGNGAYYRFAAFPPHQDKNTDIPVTMELVNPTNEPATVKVSFKLYGWDAQTEDNLLNMSEEILTLKPKETRILSYLDTNRTYSVHLLVATAQYEDTKSILDIRYVREGVDHIRLNFPAVMQYPLLKDKQNTVFSCVHNAGENTVAGNKLILTLKDSNNNIIHTYTYDGAVSGAMMAVKDDFIPKETYKNFSLEAKLYQDNLLVDEATMRYSCDALGAECPKDTLAQAARDMSPDTTTTVLITLASLLTLLLLFMMHRRWKSTAPSSATPVASIIFALVFTASMVGGVGEVEGKSVGVNAPWNYMKNTPLFGRAAGGYLIADIYNFEVTVNRNAYAYKNGIAITEEDAIAVGDTLSFTAPVVDTDVVWFGTGGYWDSPYGHWRENASRPPSVNEESDYLNNSECGGYNGQCFMWFYNPLSVNPSTITYTHDGSTAVLECNENGSSCEVIHAGTIKVQVRYSATYGKFYYRYKVSMSDDNPWYRSRGWYYQNGNWQPPAGFVEAMEFYSGYRMFTDSSGRWWWSWYPDSPMRECGTGAAHYDNECGGYDEQYLLPVPAQQIDFTFTAVSPSLPPSPPTITGPTTGGKDIAHTFTAKDSRDPDDDTIRYGFDFDKNGTVDVWSPSSGYVPSGGSGTANKTWIAPTTATFQVLAEDDGGMRSGWTQHTITLTQASACENTIDDDFDGFVDYPNDPGCTDVSDDDETDTNSNSNMDCGLSVEENCAVGPSNVGEVFAGTCVNGTSGDCRYDCVVNGVWTKISNTCADAVGGTPATLTANPNVVNSGQASTLTWDGTATGCAITVGGNTTSYNSANALGGLIAETESERSTGNLTGSSIQFNLWCPDGLGVMTYIDSATVQVLGSIHER